MKILSIGDLVQLFTKAFRKLFWIVIYFYGSAVKNPPAMWEIWVRSLGWEDPLEKEKATYSSILAWRISWTV